MVLYVLHPWSYFIHFRECIKSYVAQRAPVPREREAHHTSITQVTQNGIQGIRGIREIQKGGIPGKDPDPRSSADPCPHAELLIPLHPQGSAHRAMKTSAQLVTGAPLLNPTITLSFLRRPRLTWDNPPTCHPSHPPTLAHRASRTTPLGIRSFWTWNVARTLGILMTDGNPLWWKWTSWVTGMTRKTHMTWWGANSVSTNIP